jgi:hypothetical protein
MSFQALADLECSVHVELPVHALLSWPEMGSRLLHRDYLRPVHLVRPLGPSRSSPISGQRRPGPLCRSGASTRCSPARTTSRFRSAKGWPWAGSPLSFLVGIRVRSPTLAGRRFSVPVGGHAFRRGVTCHWPLTRSGASRGAGAPRARGRRPRSRIAGRVVSGRDYRGSSPVPLPG